VLEQFSTAFGTRVMLAQSHVRSVFFGVKSSNIIERERVNLHYYYTRCKSAFDHYCQFRSRALFLHRFAV